MGNKVDQSAPDGNSFTASDCTGKERQIVFRVCHFANVCGRKICDFLHFIAEHIAIHSGENNITAFCKALEISKVCAVIVSADHQIVGIRRSCIAAR